MNDAMRAEAERRAGRSDPSAQDASGAVETEDAHTLIHELRVHQIELELQNEELQSAQAGLEQTRAEYAQLYNEAPVGYVTLDGSAVIHRANRTFAQILSVDSETVTNRPITDFMNPENRAAFLRRYGAVFRQPQDKCIDVTFRTGQGMQVVVQLRTTRFNERDEQLQAAVLDVTARRRAEEQTKRLLEQKQLLLRELNHRTKNNYQIIMSMLSLQAGMDSDPRTRNTLEEAKGRVRAMMVVHEALSRSEDDTGTDVAAYLEDLINRIVAVLDPEGRVELSTQFDTCRVNATLAYNIGIVVNEIVTNAYKHAFEPDRGGSLQISVVSSPGSAQYPKLRLTITDSLPDRAESNEQPAEENSLPVNTAGKDTPGLGRLIVDSLANQMRGTVEIDSHSSGTRFILEVPIPAEA